MRLTKEQIEKELDDLNGYLGKHQLSGYGVEWLEGKTVYAVKTYVKKSGNDGHVWFITNWIDEAKNAKRMILRYLHLEYYGKPYFNWRVDEMPANKYRWFMVSVYNNQKTAFPKRDDKEASHG